MASHPDADGFIWLELGLPEPLRHPDFTPMEKTAAAWRARLDPEKTSYRAAVLSLVPAPIPAGSDDEARERRAWPLRKLLRKLDENKAYYERTDERVLPKERVFGGGEKARPREECLKFYTDMIDELEKEYTPLNVGTWRFED